MVYWLWHKNRAKTPAKMDGKMLGLNPSKSNGFQIGQARYPRLKGRASFQSDMEAQIHTITSGKNYRQVHNFGDGAVR